MSNRQIWSMVAFATALMWTPTAEAQVALKTNLLYDATATPNLGIEVGLGKKHSAQIFYGLNFWDYTPAENEHQKHAKHWSVMPEYRWWQCSVMNGFFWGVHAMGGQFNVANMYIPQVGVFFAPSAQTNSMGQKVDGNIFKSVRDSRVEGAFIGAGVTVGYQWILGRHWNLEVEVGAGYDYVWTDHYRCDECDKLLHAGGVNYVGLTKAGVSLMYVF